MVLSAHQRADDGAARPGTYPINGPTMGYARSTTRTVTGPAADRATNRRLRQHLRNKSSLMRMSRVRRKTPGALRLVLTCYQEAR